MKREWGEDDGKKVNTQQISSLFTSTQPFHGFFLHSPLLLFKSISLLLPESSLMGKNVFHVAQGYERAERSDK